MAIARMRTPAVGWYETAPPFWGCEDWVVGELAAADSVLLMLLLMLLLLLLLLLLGLASPGRVTVGVATVLGVLGPLLVVAFTEEDEVVPFVPRGGGESTRDWSLSLPMP